MWHGAVGTAGARAGTTNSQMIGAEHQQESDQNFQKSSRVSAAGLHGPRLVHTRSLFKLPQAESYH